MSVSEFAIYENELVINRSPTKFESNRELRKAVLLYKNERAKAIEKYGLIENWDVSQIWDFSDVFGISSWRQMEWKRKVENPEAFDENMAVFDDYEFWPDFNEDISKWDVSNGKEFCGMFANCELFNQDLSNWDVSNGEQFSDMFKGCENFNQDLSKWNVSNAKNIISMFEDCYEFNADISNWDISNVEELDGVMSNCLKFNHDISGWKLHKYIARCSLSYAFWNMTSYEYELPHLSTEWEVIPQPKPFTEPMDCPVTLQPITDEYIQCWYCEKCFDVCVKDEWVVSKYNCPHCRKEWSAWKMCVYKIGGN